MYYLLLTLIFHKKDCLVMRIKQLITHSKLSKVKSKILTTCLQLQTKTDEFRILVWS